MAMAAATMAMATASTARFATLASRAHTNYSRNGAVSRLGAPAATSSSLSCTFAPFSVLKSGGRKASGEVLKRAAEVGNGEVATEQAQAPAAEETQALATKETEALAAEETGALAAEETEAPAAEAVQAPTAEEVEVQSEQQRQGRKLYVGNLPWSCDSEQLAKICMRYGAVDAVEVIYEQDTGRSRGFAFVTMASNEDAQAVIKALDGSDLEGRALRVDFPRPTPNNPRVVNPGPRRPGNVNKIFVGNLPWACDEEALIQLFSDHGKVVEAKVVYDKDTGRSRGFGFVTMDSAEEVNKAIENLDGAEYGTRRLRVDKVEPRSPPRQD